MDSNDRTTSLQLPPVQEGSSGDGGSNTSSLLPGPSVGIRKSVVSVRGLPELIELNDHHDSEGHDEEDYFRRGSEEEHTPPPAPWLAESGSPKGGAAVSVPPKSGSSGTQAASRQNTAPSTPHTPWRSVGSAKPKHDAWRTPGHHDDATTWEVAQRKDREFVQNARIAGEFVAGSRGRSPMTSTSDTACFSSTVSRRPAPPAHNPYDGGWLGAAPTGCWVLHHGRPRCVDADQLSRQTSSGHVACANESKKCPLTVQAVDAAATQGQSSMAIGPPMLSISIETGDLSGGLSIPGGGGGGLFAGSSPPSRRMSCLRGSNAAAANEAQQLAVLAGMTISTRSSSSSSSSSDGGDMTLARSCLSIDARKALEERKKQKQFEKVAARRQSRVNFDNAALDQQQVEDIQDILQHLEEKDKDAMRHARPVLARFSWVPPSPHAPLNGLPGSPRPESRQTLLFPGAVGGGDPALAPRASAMTPGGGRASLMNAGGQHSPSHSHHRMSMMKRESHLTMTSTMTNKSLSGSSITLGVAMEHKRQGLRVNRDLKAEIKRMKDQLLSSAQNAFGNDVWERCGIESEHIKRQQLAQLIHGGLGCLFKKNDQETGAFGQDQNADGSAPGTPNKSRRQSVKRASTVSNAASVAGGDAEQIQAEQARRSTRKSVLKSTAAKRRQSNANTTG